MPHILFSLRIESLKICSLFEHHLYSPYMSIEAILYFIIMLYDTPVSNKNVK